MADITMPRLSDTMSEGAVGRWLKKPGDKVQRDEVIAEIETDKATMDLVSFEDGTLQEILVPEGKIVPIGEVIGIIGNGPAKAAPKKDAKGAAKDAKAADAKAADAKSAEAPAAAKDAARRRRTAPRARRPALRRRPRPAQAEADEDDAAPQGGQVARDGDRVKASPVARRVAEEHGVDLRAVPGTGPGGRILKANVEEFRQKGGAPAAAKPAAPAAQPKGEVTPLSRIRKAVARAMNESKPGVPHIYLTVEIDMGPAMALRKQINDSGAAGVNISPNDLIIKAVARALTQASVAQRELRDDARRSARDDHASADQRQRRGRHRERPARAGRQGRRTRRASGRSPPRSRISPRARATAGSSRTTWRAPPSRPPTSACSASSSSSRSSRLPQAASLAVGAIRQVPVVKDGAVTVGERLNVTLSVDHRVADGAAAAQYLQELTSLLQAPFSLLI